MSRISAVALTLVLVLSVVTGTVGAVGPAPQSPGAAVDQAPDPTALATATAGDATTNGTETARTDTPVSAAAVQSTTPIVTGFHRPQVDGLVYGAAGRSLPETKAGEWADGYNRSATFTGPNGAELEGRLYVKTLLAPDRARSAELSSPCCPPTTYVGVRMSAPADPIRSVTVGLDRDGSGDRSPGDVRIVARAPDERSFEGDSGAFTFEEMWTPTVRDVRVYADGQFVPIGDVADVGDDALARPVGTVAIANSGDFVDRERFDDATTIETAINESTLDALLDARDEDDDGDTVGVSVSFDTEVGSYDVRDSLEGYDLTGRNLDREILIPELIIPKIDLGTDLEVAQALHTEGNDLPLTADKQTLARAFVTHNKSSDVEVRVTFTAYSATGSGTLGSRTVTFDAPPGSPDRMDLDDSANLELPAAWTDDPIFLKVTVDPTWGIESPYTGDSTDVEFLGFTETRDLSVYRLMVNVGTSSNPQTDTTANRDLVSQTLVDTFPIAEGRFTDVSSSTVGAYGPNAGNNRGQLRSDLDSLSDQLEMARNMGVAFGAGSSLPPFPDQVYGIAQVRGLSDPPWGGGPGESFAGIGSFFAVTMAHEVNHNVGDDPWAYHVAGGCNSGGGDSDWASTFSDNDINRIGWNPGSGLVASTTPDLMTYCRPAWISDYRWTRMHERMRTFQSGEPVHPNLQSATTLQVPSSGKEILGREVPTGRVITGQLYPDGTGTLDASFEQPGVVSDPETGRVLEAPAAVLVIERTDGTTERTDLDARFEDIEGADLSSSGFSVAVNDGSTIERIALVDAETEEVLAEQRRTGFTLGGARIDTPEAFERGERVDVGIDADADADGILSKRVLYSPDPETGLWYPYRPATTDDGFTAEFTEYPGGEEARFLVMFSSGVDTEFAVSEPFTVAPKPPEVSIQRNERLEAVGVDETTRDEPTAYEIRDASGPVQTTAGGTVSLDARAGDQFGASLADRETANSGPTIRWTLAGSDATLDTGPRFTRTFATPGSYEVRVTATDPTTGLTASDSITVEVDEPPLPDSEDVRQFREAVARADEGDGTGDGGVTVALEPAAAEASPQGTTTVTVVASGIDAGVGSYTLIVNTSDTSRARVVELTDRIGGISRQELAADGSGGKLAAFSGDTADSGPVPIANVTLATGEVGDVGLTVTVGSISNEAGTQYEVSSTSGAVLTVRERRAPEVVVGRPSIDLDGDGLYEDVNGDGDATPGDATVLFNAVFEGNAAVRDNSDLFDFNRDGDVTPGDATVLFNQVF